MAKDEKDQTPEPTPVKPASAEASPSSTGVVAGSEAEPDEAKPDPDERG